MPDTLTQADAETVLLAIGGLQWSDINNCCLTEYIGEGLNDWYAVEPDLHQANHYTAGRQSYANPFPPESPAKYASKADARSACERHHATGKWD